MLLERLIRHFRKRGTHPTARGHSIYPKRGSVQGPPIVGRTHRRTSFNRQVIYGRFSRSLGSISRSLPIFSSISFWAFLYTPGFNVIARKKASRTDALWRIIFSRRLIWCTSSSPYRTRLIELASSRSSFFRGSLTRIYGPGDVFDVLVIERLSEDYFPLLHSPKEITDYALMCSVCLVIMESLSDPRDFQVTYHPGFCPLKR